MQVYFIGAVSKQGLFLPAVFMLLPGKTQEMYEKCFQVIVDVVGDVSHVESFSGDFEMAVINVVEDLLPNATFNGCYFHFKQSIYRNLKQSGSLPVLQCVPEFEKVVQMIYALPFVPIDNITNIYEKVIFPVMEKAEHNWIGDTDDHHDDYKTEVRGFMTKMENSWIGKSIRRGRRAPIHAPDTWSYYDSLCRMSEESSATNVALTNNMVEGLHSAFAPNVPKNATVWSVIICFQKEEMITRLKYNESLSGEESTHNKKRKTNNIKKMQALAEICRSYPDFKQKITFMEILLKHFGEGGNSMNKE